MVSPELELRRLLQDLLSELFEIVAAFRIGVHILFLRVGETDDRFNLLGLIVGRLRLRGFKARQKYDNATTATPMLFLFVGTAVIGVS